ncbi:hypothetical protein [Pseudomonas fluorescens]|nr:hypothetical protein [Pseudomonas fluorescens]
MMRASDACPRPRGIPESIARTCKTRKASTTAAKRSGPTSATRAHSAACARQAGHETSQSETEWCRTSDY